MTQSLPLLPPDFVSSLSLGSARGGSGAKAALELTYVRDLVPADLATLSQPKASTPIPIAQLRETHHMLARLIAEGRNGVECSAITGYSQSRVSILKSDPAFQELVSFYKEGVSQQYSDMHSRLATLGTIAAEVLQERILDTPETFSHRELREVMDSCMAHVGPAAKVAAQQGAQSQAVNLNIQFVEPTSKPGMVIDIQAKDAT